MPNHSMTLIEDLVRLRDDCLTELDSIHNYHTHTKGLWRLVQGMVQEGEKFTIENQETNSTWDESELLEMAQGYVTGYLSSATFQHFVSVFEQFVFDFIRLWLTEYPNHLAERELQFQTVLDAEDKSEIVAAVVQKKVLGITYDPIAKWFTYLENLAALNCPTQEQIQQLTEIKASRNVLVHQNGIVDSRYIDICNSSGGFGNARFEVGDQLELPDDYHNESWRLVKQVVSEMATTGIDKLQRQGR